MPRTLEECANALAVTHRLQLAAGKVYKKINRALEPFYRVPDSRLRALPVQIEFKLGNVFFTVAFRGERKVTFRRANGPVSDSLDPDEMRPGDLLELASLSSLNQNAYDQAVMNAVLNKLDKVAEVLANAHGVDMDALGDKPLAAYSAEFMADLTAPQ